jgi:hypothetical protein
MEWIITSTCTNKPVSSPKDPQTSQQFYNSLKAFDLDDSSELVTRFGNEDFHCF